jgi:CDP-diacylglycerol--serine O-phosphatidyltransferase
MSKLFPVLKHFNLPNLITTGGLIFGIIACYFLTLGDLTMAIFFLFFAGVMDLVDGWVAAKLNQLSEFGQYLDTMVDFFTCVIIPVWMVFDLIVQGDIRGNILIVVALCFYCMCGLWRLSYYNLTRNKGSFTGLPVPGAMMCVTIVIWFVTRDVLPVFAMSITFALLGTLMVSSINLRKYGPWQIIMGLVGLAFMLWFIITDMLRGAI